MNGPKIESDSEIDVKYILGHYIDILKVRKRVIIVFMISLLISVFVATSFSTRYYASTAVVEISPRAPVVFEVEQVSEVGSSSSTSELRSYYGTQYRIIQSDTVFSKAIMVLRDEHGVDDFDDLDKPIQYLRSHMKLVPQRETTLVHIKFEYPDSDKAALFANIIAEVYMEANLDRAFQAARDALKWLEAEHEKYRLAKHSSEEKVHEFRFEHQIIGVDDQYNATMDSLDVLQTSWSTLHAKRIDKEAVFKNLSQQYRSGKTSVLAKRLAKDEPTLTTLLGEKEKLLLEQYRLQIRYLEQYPERVRLTSELKGIEQLIESQVQDIIDGVQSEVETLMAQEQAMLTELELLQGQVEELDRRVIELQSLVSEAERNDIMFQGLDLRMSEVDLSQFIRANNIRFVDRASPTDVYVRPNMALNLVLALLLGLIGGCGLAFLLEFLDNTIKSARDLNVILGAPLLGAVHHIDPVDQESIVSQKERALYAHTRPRSAIGEALRSIRTNVLFRVGNKHPKTLLMTSSVPQEGKSFLSSNLAAIMAMPGTRVLLIDADLRRPSVHRIFDMANETGFSDVLLGKMQMSDVVRQTHVPNLDIVTAGAIPPSPTELLESDIMRNIHSQIHGYDVIFFDSPPVTLVTDPIVISLLVDGVIFVVESGSTRKPIVQSAINRLQQVNARVLGGIVNRLEVKRDGYGYYYGGYYYTTYGGYYSEEEYELQKEAQLAGKTI